MVKVGSKLIKRQEIWLKNIKAMTMTQLKNMLRT